MSTVSQMHDSTELEAAYDSGRETDEFMVYGFKVLPCRRGGRHDWRECPFAHPGEVAKRRDPRRFNYVGIICPDAKQNTPCPRGDACPYTHSLFEYWLHPTRYKTELCSRGESCTRPFCFFAHSRNEMRPVDTDALLAVAMKPRIATVQQKTAGSNIREFQRELNRIRDPVEYAKRLDFGVTQLFQESSLYSPNWPQKAPFGYQVPLLSGNELSLKSNNPVLATDEPSSDAWALRDEILSKLGSDYLQTARSYRHSPSSLEMNNIDYTLHQSSPLFNTPRGASELTDFLQNQNITHDWLVSGLQETKDSPEEAGETSFNSKKNINKETTSLPLSAFLQLSLNN